MITSQDIKKTKHQEGELHGLHVTVTLPAIQSNGEDYSEETETHVLTSALDIFGAIRIGKAYTTLNILDNGQLNEVDVFPIMFNANEESLPVIREWCHDVAKVLKCQGVILEYAPVYKGSPELIEG